MIQKKQLEIKLQKLESHPNPTPELEQYMTPGGIAAALLHLAYSQGAIKDKVVSDLGCGTGRLAIGAALLGARKVIGVEVDDVALEVAERNATEAGVEIGWINSDVGEVNLSGIDTIIQNPPFGVQKRGADMMFLEKAMGLASEVYSIHKATPKNREFIANRVKEWGGEITHRVELEFHIPSQFEFHTREVYRFKVDIYRIIGG